MDNSGNTSTFLGSFLFIGLIVLLILVLRNNGKQVKQSEQTFYKILQSLPVDKQTIFTMQFNSVKKNPTVAVILALFLGGLGIHKFYMGKTGWGVLYLLFCWTFIPAVISFVEAFVISGQVGKYNKQKAVEIATMLGGTNLQLM